MHIPGAKIVHLAVCPFVLPYIKVSILYVAKLKVLKKGGSHISRPTHILL